MGEFGCWRPSVSKYHSLLNTTTKVKIQMSLDFKVSSIRVHFQVSSIRVHFQVSSIRVHFQVSSLEFSLSMCLSLLLIILTCANCVFGDLNLQIQVTLYTVAI